MAILSHPHALLVIAATAAAAALLFLSTGTLVPYPLVRNGVYMCAAFLGLFSFSLVASYWIDLGEYKLRSDRDRSDLKRRITLALFLLAGAGLLLRLWEFQEDRELLEAREAYDSGDFVHAKELFLQQRQRFWTTDPSYKQISHAVRATEAGRKYQELSQKRVLYPPKDPRYDELSNIMKQLETQQADLYPKWGK